MPETLKKQIEDAIRDALEELEAIEYDWDGYTAGALIERLERALGALENL